MSQSQEGIKIHNAASMALDCDEDAPGNQGVVDLLTPPETTGGSSNDFEGVLINTCISEPTSAVPEDFIAALSGVRGRAAGRVDGQKLEGSKIGREIECQMRSYDLQEPGHNIRTDLGVELMPLSLDQVLKDSAACCKPTEAATAKLAIASA